MSKIFILLIVSKFTLSDVIHYHFDNDNGNQIDNNHDWFFGGGGGGGTFNPSFVLHNGMKVVLEANKKYLND